MPRHRSPLLTRDAQPWRPWRPWRENALRTDVAGSRRRDAEPTTELTTELTTAHGWQVLGRARGRHLLLDGTGSSRQAAGPATPRGATRIGRDPPRSSAAKRR